MLSFTFCYASLWRRAVAMLIDLGILAIGDLLLLQPFVDVLGVRQFAEASMASPVHANAWMRAPFSVAILRYFGLWSIVALILAWLYFATQESPRAQGTIGKRMMGLMVFTKEEARLTFRQASARFFSKLISASALMIGFIIAAFDPKCRALHDRISGTRVLRSAITGLQDVSVLSDL